MRAQSTMSRSGSPAIVQFILGAGWYTVLGTTWMAGIGKDEMQTGGRTRPLAAAVRHCRSRPALVIAYALAWLLPRSAPQSRGERARKPAPLLGLALIGTTLAQNYGFEARPLSLWLINAGYMIVGMAVDGRHRRPLDEEGRDDRPTSAGAPCA